MNHSPSGSLFLSKAIPGFINYKTAEGLALRTIDSHERLCKQGHSKPTATPIIEPVLLPVSAAVGLTVESPDFNLPATDPGQADSTFYIIDTQAIYAWYHQQEGTAMWASETDFIANLTAYAGQLKNQRIKL